MAFRAAQRRFSKMVAEGEASCDKDTLRLRLVLVPSHPVLLEALLAHEEPNFSSKSPCATVFVSPMPAAHLLDLALLGCSQDRLPLRILQGSCFCSKDLTHYQAVHDTCAESARLVSQPVEGFLDRLRPKRP